MHAKDKRRKPGLYPIPLQTAADLLGCTKPHLSLVLRKLRPSKSLTTRYRDLVKQEARR